MSNDKREKCKQVCVLIRLSKEDLDNAIMVVNRQKMIIDLIDNEPNWEYFKAYVTTDSIDDAFQDLLKDCRSGKVDVIIIRNLSQLGKCPEECLQTASMIRGAAGDKIDFISIDESIFLLDEAIDQIEELIDGSGNQTEKKLGNQIDEKKVQR